MTRKQKALKEFEAKEGRVRGRQEKGEGCVCVLGNESLRKTARDASFILHRQSKVVAGPAVDDGYEGEEERGFDGRRGSICRAHLTAGGEKSGSTPGTRPLLRPDQERAIMHQAT